MSKDWLEDCKKDLQKTKKLMDYLQSTSIPLEDKSKRILIEQGYHAISTMYDDQLTENGSTKTKQREIDIHAFRVCEYPIKELDITFTITTNVIGECKHFKKADLLVFEADRSKSWLKSKIPYIGNAKYFLKIDKIGFDFFEDLVMVSKIKKMTESEINKIINEKSDEVGNKESKNCKSGKGIDEVYDKVTNQLLPALNYFVQQTYVQSVNVFWQNNVLSKFDEEKIKLKNGPNFISRGELERDLEVCKRIPQMKFTFNGSINIDLFIPIFIVNEATRIVKVSYKDDNYFDLEFNDIPFAMYTFGPSEPAKYTRIISDTKEIPIIICNVGTLGDVLDKINKKVKECGDKLVADNKTKQKFLENLVKAYHEDYFQSRGRTLS